MGKMDNNHIKNLTDNVANSINVHNPMRKYNKGTNLVLAWRRENS